jgi:hypothetical protein
MNAALPIITADQRLAESRGIKGVIFGRSGIGKTSLLWTLRHSTTMFFDLEAGDLAIEGLAIDSIRPRTWTECRDFAVFIGGPNPALRDDQVYSAAHYAAVCQKFGDPAALDKYDTVFIDSITVAGRLCFQWCKGQPEAHSEKTGKPDVRGAYGLHGREMIAWLTHLQHTRGKNIWFVGILDENHWGYPAKDRSGRLGLIEPPHLGQLMDKIRGPLVPAERRLTYQPPQLPKPSAATEETPNASSN